MIYMRLPGLEGSYLVTSLQLRSLTRIVNWLASFMNLLRLTIISRSFYEHYF
jgi:hypothetical protein